MKKKLPKELSIAVKAAKAAGKILANKFGSVNSINYKKVKDIVTEADIEAENKIISIIKKSFPSHSILAEESGRIKQKSDFLWVIDPLDGTVNFARGIPLFGVSIALQYKEEIILGAIFVPKAKELFFAEKGKGAYLNGKKIRVSNVIDMSRAMYYFNDFNVGIEKENDFLNEQKLKLTQKFSGKVLRFRCLGSAVIELASLACGRIDAYSMIKFGYWDIAAGKIIIEEAGGKMTDFNGKPVNIDCKNILASNGKLHNAILQYLKE